MKQVNIHEARAHLSRLLREVQAGEDIVIARNGHPVARIVPLRTGGTRRPGAWRGRVQIADDFDDCDSSILTLFEDG